MGSCEETANSSEVNIVVPIFKVEEYLARCIDSVLRQTYEKWNLTLIDDGSPALDASAADDYALQDARIMTIHQRNGGLSAARNTGIDLAFLVSRGKWITFIDSDDWVHEEYLPRLLEAAKKHNVPIVVGEHKVFQGSDDADQDKTNNSDRLWKTEDYWVFNRTNATTAWGKLYRLSLFKNKRYPFGRIDEDEYVTFNLLFENEQIAVVQYPLYSYFRNENGISNMNYVSKMEDVIEAFYLQYCFFKKSKWNRAYKLSVIMYASSLAYALNGLKRGDRRRKGYRRTLRALLRTEKKKIPCFENKFIYISAYPYQEYFIRIFGLVSRF